MKEALLATLHKAQTRTLGVLRKGAVSKLTTDKSDTNP